MGEHNLAHRIFNSASKNAWPAHHIEQRIPLGSTDRTAEIVRLSGTVVVRHPENRAIGAAVRKPVRTAIEGGADTVACLDADLEYYPEDIPRLVEPILAGRADYVLGSRFLGGDRGVRGLKLHRRAGNHASTLLLTLRRMADGRPAGEEGLTG